MNGPTEGVQILRDAGGRPAFAVIPFADYQALVGGRAKGEPTIPADVVNFAMDHDVSAARAWREHFGLTQAEVAARMDVTQSAYAQLEGRKTVRKTSREKIATALGISETQLDF